MQIGPIRQTAGIRPIGVGEVLRRIAEKVVMILLKKMFVKQQDRYSYVEGKLPDLKPRYMQCMMSSMTITREVFY